MNNYEAKKQARIERYENLAKKAELEADQRINQAHQIGDMIPFGQPILVGHHSEGRHRAAIKRIDTNMRKAVEASKKSDYYEHKAAAAENNNAISSDDPQAIDKLKAKIVDLQYSQDQNKIINKLIRKNDRAGMAELGLTESDIDKLCDTSNFGGPGIPSFTLQNNSANIRRLQKRLEKLENLRSIPTKEIIENDIRIVENVEDNRCQIFFPGIPSETIRKFLKSNGFRWSRFNGCWQRHRSNRASYLAKEVLTME